MELRGGEDIKIHINSLFSSLVDVHFLFTLTGGEMCGDALAELLVLLRVQDGSVLGVGPQVPQRVLGHPAWDPLLHRVGALDAQEETVTADDGARSLPDDQSAVMADVGETHVGGSIRFWRRRRRRRKQVRQKLVSSYEAAATVVKLTGKLLSSQRLALLSIADGVDVEAVERAGLQVGDLSVRVGGDGQLQQPHVGAIRVDGGEDHPVTRHLAGWAGPGDHDLCV